MLESFNLDDIKEEVEENKEKSIKLNQIAVETLDRNMSIEKKNEIFKRKSADFWALEEQTPEKSVS